MATGTTALLFLLYSALNGATLSVVLVIYTKTSITSTFLTAAAMFGALAVYGASRLNQPARRSSPSVTRPMTIV